MEGGGAKGVGEGREQERRYKKTKNKKQNYEREKIHEQEGCS